MSINGSIILDTQCIFEDDLPKVIVGNTWYITKKKKGDKVGKLWVPDINGNPVCIGSQDITLNNMSIPRLEHGIDILYLANDLNVFPLNKKTVVRVFNSLTSPYANGDNDFIYEVIKTDDTKFYRIIAHDVRSIRTFINSRINDAYTGWREIDGDDALVFKKHLDYGNNVFGNDLDNWKAQGIWYCTSNSIHLPSGENEWGRLTITEDGHDQYTQMFVYWNINQDKIYYRRFKYGNWSSWFETAIQTVTQLTLFNGWKPTGRGATLTKIGNKVFCTIDMIDGTCTGSTKLFDIPSSYRPSHLSNIPVHFSYDATSGLEFRSAVLDNNAIVRIPSAGWNTIATGRMVSLDVSWEV